MSDEKPNLGLANKVAIITGGTRGIGHAIAQNLLDTGCQVAICGRHAPAALPTAQGRTASFHACDVRNAEQARAFIDTVAAQHGGLDILVNNAGGSPQAEAANASARFSEAILALNLLAPLHLSQAAYRHMNAQETGGSIINIASVSGLRPSPGTAIYGAAKAGLLSLTGSLAQEWGPKVRVNAIVVGLVETESTAQTYGSAKAQADIAASLPLRRMGRGSDIAAAVQFLASSMAAYISGAQLSVDGGGERPYFLELVKQASIK